LVQSSARWLSTGRADEAEQPPAVGAVGWRGAAAAGAAPPERDGGRPDEQRPRHGGDDGVRVAAVVQEVGDLVAGERRVQQVGVGEVGGDGAGHRGGGAEAGRGLGAGARPPELHGGLADGEPGDEVRDVVHGRPSYRGGRPGAPAGRARRGAPRALSRAARGA
jgi:hypothetical protein